MKNWREVLATEKGEEKLMQGFKRYKTDNDVELPNVAEFTGDKQPSKTGDSAKVEIKAYEEGNKLMKSDKKREDKAKGTSALMSEDAKRKDMAKHISEDKEHVKPSYANKKKANLYLRCPKCNHEGDMDDFPYLSKGEQLAEGVPFEDESSGNMMNFLVRCKLCDNIFYTKEGDPFWSSDTNEMQNRRVTNFTSKKKGWRKALADVSFKNKPDGTVQIDITSHPNEPLAQNPITQQPAPSSPQEVQQKEQQTGTSAEASKKAALNLKYGLTGSPEEAYSLLKDLVNDGGLGGQHNLSLEEILADAKALIGEWEKVKQGGGLNNPEHFGSMDKKSFVQPGQRVKHINSGVTGVVEKIEGKDIYVKTDNGSTAVWGFNEVNIPTSNQTPAQNISQYFANAKKWNIKKEGNLSLIGAECEKCAGIQIEKDGKAVESYMVNKDGHEWREVVNEAVWVSKFEEHLK